MLTPDHNVVVISGSRKYEPTACGVSAIGLQRGLVPFCLVFKHAGLDCMVREVKTGTHLVPLYQARVAAGLAPSDVQSKLAGLPSLDFWKIHKDILFTILLSYLNSSPSIITWVLRGRRFTSNCTQTERVFFRLESRAAFRTTQ